MASLPVSVSPVTPRREGGVQRGEAAEGEEKRRRHERSSSFVFLFLERRDLLRADQRRAVAALSTRVVGAGAVFVIRALSLRELVDGGQLVMMRVGIIEVFAVVNHAWE